jgi:hypothetical protein
MAMLTSILRREAEERLLIAEETSDPNVKAAMLAAAASLHQEAERIELLAATWQHRAGIQYDVRRRARTRTPARQATPNAIHLAE